MKTSRFFFVLMAATVLFAGCGMKNPFSGSAQTQETQQVALPSSSEQTAKEVTFDPPSYRGDYSTADGKGPRTLASTLATVSSPTTYVVEGSNGENYQVTVEPVSPESASTAGYVSTSNSVPTVSYVPVSASRTVRHSYYAAPTDTIRYNVTTTSVTTVSRPFHGLRAPCPNPDIYTPSSCAR